MSNEQDLIKALVAIQMGSQSNVEFISNHMEEYFKRWYNYKDRLTMLEWHHLFLDFLEKYQDFMEQQKK